MKSQERAYSTKEVSHTLEIGDSTLRKWYLALEKNGYTFIKNDRAQRLFIESDLVKLRHFQTIVQQHNMQLENAAIVVVDRFGKGAFEEVTGHVPAEKPNENRSFPHSDDHISKLLKHIEQQETFNQELSFQARNISIASHSSYTKFQKVFFIEFPVHATKIEYELFNLKHLLISKLYKKDNLYK
ncbi:hypothetical protein [Aeribacillus sp. FSL K6-2833]|uniref:hypothetical protein n=1 Tax=Aeribacillus sp. FSL K6-2833 TaxID=2954611 RepID=UPI0030DB4013